MTEEHFILHGLWCEAACRVWITLLCLLCDNDNLNVHHPSKFNQTKNSSCPGIKAPAVGFSFFSTKVARYEIDLQNSFDKLTLRIKNPDTKRQVKT